MSLKYLKIFLLCCALCSAVLPLHAQEPVNDNCSNASEILIPGQQYGMGTFISEIISLRDAGVEPGESVPELLNLVGLSQKTIWYKFTIPTPRKITVNLLQRDTLIAQNAVGFAVYRSDNCFPTQGQLSNKLTAVSKFGSCQNPCLPAGTYWIQVCSRNAVADSVWLTLNVERTLYADHDRKSTAYVAPPMSGSGVTSAYINLGCYSVDSTAELFTHQGVPQTEYSQSAWMVLTTPADLNSLFLLFSGFNSGLDGDSCKLFYRLYQGNAKNNPNGLILKEERMFSTPLYGEGSTQRIETAYICELQSNTTFSLEIFYPTTATGNTNIQVTTQGGYKSRAMNPAALPGAYKAGNLSPGQYVNIIDTLGCQSLTRLYRCGNTMPDSVRDTLSYTYITWGGPVTYTNIKTYDMSTWFTFTIPYDGIVQFNPYYINCNSGNMSGGRNYLYRIFKGDVAQNCNLPLYMQRRDSFSMTLCLSAGTYSCQLMGSQLKSAGTYSCYNSDIGTIIRHTLYFQGVSSQGTSQFDTPVRAENLGDISSTLAGGNTVFPVKDFFNGVTDTSRLDSLIFPSHRVYRRFYLGRPTYLNITIKTGGAKEANTYNNILLKGNIAQGIEVLDKLEPGKFQYSTFGSEFRTQCYPLDTGWYTLVSGTETGCTDMVAWISNFIITPGQELCPASMSPNRPHKALLVNNGVGLRYGPNTGTPDLPFYTSTYMLPPVCFRCEPDEHPENHPIVPCEMAPGQPYQRMSYFVFKLDVTAHVQFLQNGNAVQDNTSKLFRLDVRTDSAGMLDPLKQVSPCGLGSNFCQLESGTYTWVAFNYGYTSVTYTILVDAVTTPRFDFAAQTQDMGLLAPNVEVVSAPERMSCLVGAATTDPASSGYQSYGWIKGSNTSIEYPVGKNSAQPAMPRRNVWYSFALDRPGYVAVTLETPPGLPISALPQPVSVYRLKADGRLSVAQLLATGQLDSAGINGLTWVTNNSMNGYTQPTFTIEKPDCGYTRYLVVADNHYRNYWDITTRMRLKFQDNSVNNAGDSCSRPIAFTVGLGSQVSKSAYVNCHTLGEGFGENGSNMGCVPGGKKMKSTWFRADVQTSSSADITFSIDAQTNSREIYYRLLYGSCEALTPGPCADGNGASFTLDCMQSGSYYVQVFTPEEDFGQVTLTVKATPTHYSVCKPFNLFTPLANFNVRGGCNGDSIRFINLSSAGSAIRYQWLFSNGDTSRQAAPVKWFTSPKPVDTVMATLIVRDILHQTADTFTQPVTLFKGPFYLTAGFDDTVSCVDKRIIKISTNFPLPLSAQWTPDTGLSDAYSLTPTIIPDVSRTYILKAMSANCVFRDTIQITRGSPGLIVNAGGICPGYNTVLRASKGYSNYYWENAFNNADTLVITQPGTYRLQAWMSGCMDTASITVASLAKQTTVLGRDTVICSGDTLLLDAGDNRAIWVGGNIGRYLKAYRAGTYHIRIPTDSCFTYDTIRVGMKYTGASLPATLALCPDSSMQLGVTDTFTGYLWNTGSTGSRITIKAPATYTLRVIHNGCRSTDSTRVSWKMPPLNLGPDTFICNGKQLTIGPSATYQGYLWSTGETTRQINVGKGTYQLKVTQDNCVHDDDIEIRHLPGKAPYLGPDTLICGVFEKVLDAGIAESYWWKPTGEITRTITATRFGVYTVTITDSLGCDFSDSIFLEEDCPPTIYIPNAFTPNKDPFNPEFQIKGTFIKKFEITIYNRWGEKVFYSNDMNESWDGTYRGTPVPEGVYIWIMKYNTRLHVFHKSGSVTLIR